MGIAASSALRVDTASDGLAYGSLEAMGGGARKLKKKPVLVLDPDELAQAHAMFHEASAELLGDDVERAPRPAAILGLAPMDNEDEPDDLDQTDDVETEDEADLPSPEAVLALTRRRTPPPPLGDFVSEDPAADMGAMGSAMDELPIVPRIEDDLDMATRIFPSLSLHPDQVDENKEPEARSPDLPEEPASLPAELEAEPQPEPLKSAVTVPEPTKVELQKPEAITAQPTERAEPKEEFTFSPATPSPRAAPEQAAKPAPVAPKLTEPTPIEPTPIEPAPVAGAKTPRPVRFDELNPAKDYGTPEEVYDLDSWLAEPQDDDQPSSDPAEPEPAPEVLAVQPSQPETTSVPEAMPSSEPEFELSNQQEIPPLPDEEPKAAPADVRSDVTLTEDDRIDGYAFMRDPRSRRSTVVSAPQGRQSALRAKLMREAEQEAAEAERANASGSDLAAFWNWLRGLFKPKG